MPSIPTMRFLQFLGISLCSPLALEQSNTMKIPPRTKPREAPVFVEHDVEPRRLAPYAAMAYCGDTPVIRKTCGPCKRIDRAVVFKGIYQSHLDAHALLLLDHQRKEVVASFRGMVSWTNFKKVIDIDRHALLTHIFENATETDEVKHARVHHGFKETADSLNDYILPELKELLAKHRDYRLQLVGHSLGGAIATIMTVTVHQKLKLPFARMSLTTYGQPRVGNYVFAKWFNALPITVTRVVNEDDAVPHLPGNWNGFVHTKTELFITKGITVACPPGDRELENPRCSNGRIPELGYSAHLQAWDTLLSTTGC